MLTVVLSHWAFYCYLTYVFILLILLVVYRHRSASEQEGQPERVALTWASEVAEARTARYRRAGNSELPGGYRYVRWL